MEESESITVKVDRINRCLWVGQYVEPFDPHMDFNHQVLSIAQFEGLFRWKGENRMPVAFTWADPNLAVVLF